MNSEKDSQILLGLQNAMFGESSGQLSDWIFVDECVFSCKTYKQMAWAETGHNVKQSEHLGAQPCVAVVAAVSMRRGMICFHARPKSFTAATFQDFLQDLRDEMPSGRLSVLLDNCSIHKARVTLAKAAELQMDLHFNVPYAPQFNGIEYVWNIAKQKFRKLQLQRMLKLNDLGFMDCIYASLSGLPSEQVARCFQRGIENLRLGSGSDTCPAK